MSPLFDSDPMLRRLERRALLVCLAAAVASVVVRRGDPDVALGVVGGGVLMATSYWAIRSSVGALVSLVATASVHRPRREGEPEAAGGPGDAGAPRAAGDAATPAAPGETGEPEAASAGRSAGDLLDEVRPNPAVILARLAGRYALLGLMAYGMIARLRLHPVGLILGISSLFAAASLEVLQGPGRRRR